MGIPTSKTIPKWLLRWEREGVRLRDVKYYRALYNQRPPWANLNIIRMIYAGVTRMNNYGHNLSVDHIVPLHHPYVCGLHCEDNLTVIPRELNSVKSNTVWPQMWDEQLELNL